MAEVIADEKARKARLAEWAAQAGFDVGNLSIVNILCAVLSPVIDRGTSIDTGSGADSADLWPKIGGVEYYITVRKSNAQIAKEK